MIHILDLVRHFVAYTFQPYAWSPNISASIITAGAVTVAVKVFRKRAEAWLHRAAHKIIKPHLDAHLAAVKEHVTSELERLK